jgi:hypothetical protein
MARAKEEIARTVKLDAVNRAWRTFYVAIGFDAALLIGAGLTDLLSTADVTSQAFWIAFGIVVVKSVLISFASYLLRLKKAPNVDSHPDLTL